MRSNPLIDTVYKVAKGKEATKVSENTRNLRLATCRTCILPNGKKGMLPTGNCKKCGCFVDLKTEYAEESCPIGKW